MGDMDSEIAVVGAGAAGMSTAIALALHGFDVVVAAPAYTPARAEADTRTTALLPPSIQFLENIGVWPLCRRHSAALAGVRIIDDRGGLVRAPEVLFAASEIGAEVLGANIPNAALGAGLFARMERMPAIRWVTTSAVAAVETGASHARLLLAEGASIHARLVVAADGRNSVARAAAGIEIETWDYPQAAVATSFCHSRSHGGITTEFHRRAGPLTTVPLPGSASSLVWVEEPTEAARIAGLPEEDFRLLLERRLQGLLGTVESCGPRAVFPLRALNATTMAQRRIALVGEAAHVIAPIGAQGLNLGLRDVAALTDCVADARARGADIGDPQTLAAYARARAADVLSRTVLVDLLNRSLLTDLAPVQAARGFGLHLLSRAGPLRRLAIRGGAGAAGPLPRSMLPR